MVEDNSPYHRRGDFIRNHIIVNKIMSKEYKTPECKGTRMQGCNIICLSKIDGDGNGNGNASHDGEGGYGGNDGYVKERGSWGNLWEFDSFEEK